MAIVQDLLEVEKAVLDAAGEVADTAADTVKAGLEAAAQTLRNVIEAVTGPQEG